MRKALVITALLLVLSIVGMTAAAVCVSAPRADVVLTETVLSGDPAAAEGLEINLRTKLDYQLFWNTVLRPGSRPESDTTFDFTVGKTYEEGSPSYSGMEMQNCIAYGLGFREDEEPQGINKVYKELYDKSLADGQEHTMRVYLKDYYDYYPIEFMFNAPNCSVGGFLREYDESALADAAPGTEAYVYQKLQDFFHIPVLEDEQMELHVAVGNGVSCGTGSVEGSDSFDLWTYSTLTEDECYFTFNPHTRQGNTVDLSLIPGGYGLYRLPYDADRHDVSGQKACPLDIDALEMVYALDPSVWIIDLRTDPKEENLLLLTNEGDSYVLTVIGLETMETVQRLVLWDDPDTRGNLYYDGGDFLVMSLYQQVSDGETEQYISLLARREDGVYEQRFTVPTDETVAYRYGYTYAMTYDGERLAHACFILTADDRSTETDNPVTGTHYILVTTVYDETGLLYRGEWRSSLDTGYSEQYDYYCRPFESDPISLQWK